MFEAQNQLLRKALGRWLPTFAIASAAVLLASSNFALAQQKHRGRDRKPATNVQFAAGHSAVNIPFELIANIVVVKVRVNNSKYMKFMFDTGASGSLLSTRRAAALNLKSAGDAKLTATGGNAEGSFASGVSLSVPGVKVRNQKLFLLPLDFPFCDGKDIEGILGYDFMKEFVVEINYATMTISLFDPSSYRDTAHGEVFPLIIKGTPRVRARIALPGKPEIETLLEIDTGSDGVLTLTSPFVKRHNLLSKLTAQVANSDIGMGGESGRIDARLGRLQLGRFKFDKPIVGFSTAGEGEGSMAVEDNDGPLGNEILRRFKVTIDDSRQRMRLEPNSRLSDPFESDMSGIVIDAEGKGCRIFKVVGVSEKSPAAESGIVAGDEIIAIDGKPVNQFNSARVEKLLMQDGATRSLTLRRDGKERVVAIKLRRLI
jgi:membrane-associated protease RseP (regulator of RpoE activity)